MQRIVISSQCLKLLFQVSTLIALIVSIVVVLHQSQIPRKHIAVQNVLHLTPENTKTIIKSLKAKVDKVTHDRLLLGEVLLRQHYPINYSQNYDVIYGETLQNKLLRERLHKTEISHRIYSQDLERMSQNLTNETVRVPPILHYILFYPHKEIRFHHMVCMLSGFWMTKPEYMVLWYQPPTSGQYWEYLMRNLSSVSHRVIIMYLSPPDTVYNVPLALLEHKADIVRMEILYKYGGMQFDMDVVVLKSVQPLYRYPFTIGREIHYGLCPGTMLAERGSEFLRIWHLFYQYYTNEWGLMPVIIPDALHKFYKLASSLHRWFNDDTQLCHVEEESMNRPNWKELDLIYGKDRVWNWRTKNYAVHLWFRNKKRQLDFHSVRTEDSMYGDMFRFVLFGESALLNATNSTL